MLISMKTHIKNHVFLMLVLVLLGGCSTLKSIHTVQPEDQDLHPIDCPLNNKKEECLAVANLDKKTQKRTAKSTQSEQAERRARLAKNAENRKINEEKAKARSEEKSATPTLPIVSAEVSKQDEIAQKKDDADQHKDDVAESMDCVRNNVRQKDDGFSNVRYVAYELAVLCTKKGVHVRSIANAAIPLVTQNRAHKYIK